VVVPGSNPGRPANMSDTRKGFMCRTDFLHELGDAMGGNMIYPSLNDLKRCEPCYKQCGVVEVEIKLVREVIKDSFPSG
jgi:hypothetical protein